ncbi:MAG: phosphonate metabolism protein/1,5-bisphosphokinase (PRPP-forming) PhnN [Rhodospirillales bacterium]|nr:phosphonate metabolism protein/1,5-bisphosphokinase (PRPP-forming) PhnN [Rhodospirillales bacterium]
MGSPAGTLVLVVGPSGAGKDSVMQEAGRLLSGDARYVFASRCITRPTEAGGEAHIPLEPSEFEAREQAGGFLLSWRAHGLAYGLPAALADELAAGRVVVVNVSRGVIDQARRMFPGHVRVVVVTAPKDVLAERLAHRGRESQDEIRERLERAPPFFVDGTGVLELRNEGPLKEAGQALANFLEQL